MNKVKMLTGHEIPLDGDLLFMLESLYREVALKRELKATFDDMMNEIVNLVDGMDENERLSAYMKKLTGLSGDDTEN